MTSLAHAARKAHRSDTAEWGARAGLLARGLLWLVVGVLAADVALGGHDQADKNGALGTLKDQPLGVPLLVAVALAFAAHAAFRLLDAAVGEEGWKRLWQLSRACVYGFLAVSTVRLLFSGAEKENAAKPTARVMGWPAGRTLVGIVGAGVVIAGVVMAVRGVRQDFSDKIDVPRSRRTLVERIGMAGLLGRGLVYALIGAFLVDAALRFDPKKAKGLDAALKTVAAQPFGSVLLWVAVAALLAYAVWSFCEAAYRKL